jgi:heterotetrameric sarcosine oxidase gamma subunit
MADANSPFPEARCEGAGFLLEARPAGHVLQVLPRASGADVSARLAGIAEAAPLAVRRAGPDSWLLVGEARLDGAEIARRGAAVADVGWLVDQTHGRCRLVLSGPRAAERLARGIGADLSLRGFAAGAAGDTQYGAIGVHLTRAAADRFEILVGRSFAESLWRELAD